MYYLNGAVYDPTTNTVSTVDPVFDNKGNFLGYEEDQINLDPAIFINYEEIRPYNRKTRIMIINEKLAMGEMEVKECKDCHRYYISCKNEVDWYAGKGMKPPVRCASCRKEKRENERR